MPVPLHWRRRLTRGYNQSEVLARALETVGASKVDTGALMRCRSTHRNAQLDHESRLSNVSGAFAASGSARGQKLLLIDDVLTSGATASQCAHALRQSGARWVGILTYARAGGKSDRETARHDINV